jgi:hypothetical protein
VNQKIKKKEGTMTATIELTETETREITRQRRAFEQAVADAAEDVAITQQALDLASEAAKDIANARAEKQVIAERSKLRELTKALAAAKSNLAQFNKTHPTEEDVQAAERLIATEAARVAREAARQPFLENRKEAIGLLEKLLALDAEARQMVKIAKPGVFTNGAEAASLADLVINWMNYDRDADGLAYVRRALSTI